MGVLTVKRLENGTRAVGEAGYLSVVAALEAAGVVFLAPRAIEGTLAFAVALRV